MTNKALKFGTSTLDTSEHGQTCLKFTGLLISLQFYFLFYTCLDTTVSDWSCFGSNVIDIALFELFEKIMLVSKQKKCALGCYVNWEYSDSAYFKA